MKVKINTIRKSLFYATATLLLGVCNACSDEDVYTTPVTSQMKLEVGAAYPMGSRATDAGFADKDIMGVFVVDYEKDKPGVLQPTDNRATNVKFTYHEAENRWVGSSDIFWKDKYTPVDIYGYYPFFPHLKEVAAYEFKVRSRQNEPGSGVELGGYEASDFLWAKAEKVMPTKSVVSLMYRHVMAGVKVNLSQGDGFTNAEWAELRKEVMVMNTLPVGSIDMSKGEIKVQASEPMIIYPYKYKEDFRAVVVPQTIAKNTELFSITVGSKSYSFKRPSDMVFTSGKMHKFTIRVSRQSGKGDYTFDVVDESIQPWIDDPDFHDGIVREYLSVELDAPGTLKQKLIDMGKDYKLISNLRLAGKVSAYDFSFMRDEMATLINVNLKDAILTDDNGTPNYILPGGAFNQKRMLTHVVLPDKLVEIGGQAFEKTSLMGNLIIPEGVREIGINAFCDCAGLKGELRLPSTLEVVGACAFQYTHLTCELKLPAGLRYIGGGAFASNFTGTLTLPESLTDLGSDAFSGCNFTGDLVIPQGLKIIEERAFCCGLDGNLEIPEGLIEIKAQAFAGSHIKGEVKLPKSLRFLGGRAFMDTQISKVIFGDNISFVGKEVFANCRRLRGVLEWPKNVTFVPEGAFHNCSMLEGVVFPTTVTRIGRGAFGECKTLNSIVCKGEEPPLLHAEAFWGVPRDNFSVEVPAKSVEAYQYAPNWREFKRITAYSNFVCRPQHACAINTARKQNLILNADGDWKIVSKPDWCTVSKSSGTGKTQLTLTISELAQGGTPRNGEIVFELVGAGHQTSCKVEQYDYQYAEDACIELQKATKGNGKIDILFLGDGFDAATLASGRYLEIVKKQMEYFFAIEPYKTYREYFNVHACISLSQEVGVNTLNTYRNTCFETIYGGCAQKLIPEPRLVFDYVKNHSGMTERTLPLGLVILVPNTTDYGGNTYLYNDGSAISICPPNDNPSDMRATVQHEAGGHGFGKLGDEVIERNLFAPLAVREIVNEYHRRGWYQNVSTTGKMKEVPWSHFIFDPRYSDNVDVFEGGMGYTRAIFRSEINSCMNYGIPYYNAISRQDIMRRILDYSGEGFNMDTFYATDTQEWGPSTLSRTIPYAERPATMGGHIAPKFINKRPADFL